MSYAWAFGDGETGSGAVVTHTYPTAGRYTAVVTATDGLSLLTATSRVTITAVLTDSARVIAYTYDPLGRLVAADDTTGESFAYAYDAVGNRTALTDTAGVHTYTYDDANRLTGVDGVSYTWDARGNLRSNGVFTYTYDGAGHMVRAESVSATVVYTYGLDSLLVGRSAGGATATYAWDWATGVPEMLSDGERLYLIGQETLGWADGAEWSYPLGDALGSVRQVVDGAGEVLDDRSWTPFGVEEGTAQGGLGYTGEWWDAEVSLLYLRARWYDPTAGRFTQADTFASEDRRSQAWNLYNYVLGNPLQYTDPTGHWYIDQGDPYETYNDSYWYCYVNPELPECEISTEFVEQVVSTGVDFTPVAGDAKGFVETFTGKDLITGEELGPGERLLGLVFLSEFRSSVKYSDEAIEILATAAHLDLDKISDFLRNTKYTHLLDTIKYIDCPFGHVCYPEAIEAATAPGLLGKPRAILEFVGHPEGNHAVLTYLDEGGIIKAIDPKLGNIIGNKIPFAEYYQIFKGKIRYFEYEDIEKALEIGEIPLTHGSSDTFNWITKFSSNFDIRVYHVERIGKW